MIGYFFLRIFVGMLRFVPFRALYVLSDGLAFLLCRVIGYRKKVVLENLRRAFPDKDEGEIRRIARKSYQNLTDVTLETLKSFTTPLADLQDRCVQLNVELPNSYLENGQSVIMTGGHYNNWEYLCLVIQPAFHGKVVVAYKPLTNKALNDWMNRQRERTGLKMVGMEEVFLAMRQHKDKATAYFLVADQSPSNRKSVHWVQFLNQDSAFLPGVDVLARRFDYPVMFYHIRRVRRGFYEVLYEEIEIQPSPAAETDITTAYARRLENEIREQPENWLWSHKRWKIKREE